MSCLLMSPHGVESGYRWHRGMSERKWFNESFAPLGSTAPPPVAVVRTQLHASTATSQPRAKVWDAPTAAHGCARQLRTDHIPPPTASSSVIPRYVGAVDVKRRLGGDLLRNDACTQPSSRQRFASSTHLAMLLLRAAAGCVCGCGGYRAHFDQRLCRPRTRDSTSRRHSSRARFFVSLRLSCQPRRLLFATRLFVRLPVQRLMFQAAVNHGATAGAPCKLFDSLLRL